MYTTDPQYDLSWTDSWVNILFLWSYVLDESACARRKVSAWKCRRVLWQCGCTTTFTNRGRSIMTEAAGEQKKREGIYRCPLLNASPHAGGSVTSRMAGSSDPTECIGDRCAWWHAGEQACAILVMAEALRDQASGE